MAENEKKTQDTEVTEVFYFTKTLNCDFKLSAVQLIIINNYCCCVVSL